MPGARLKGRKRRTVVTALGPITLHRHHVWSAADGGLFPADATLGVDGFLTRQATRLATLAGVDHSFARAQQVLAEMCGWAVDDEVIRRVTHAEARRVARERPTQADAATFARASGEVEVLIDAGKVNTVDGWRDVKVGVFLKRMPGESATPDRWDQRELPAPTVRTTVAAIEGCERFGDRLRAESDRLGVTAWPTVSVLGDGAEWIWNRAGLVWPQASQVLDVYHLLEHVSDAAKAVWGSDASAIDRHATAGREAVLAEGYAGLQRWVGEAIAAVPLGASPDPLIELAAYAAPHARRMAYAERLATGRSIGSGAVEGAIKQLVNLRFKRTGARWRVEHVGPLVELRAVSRTPSWNALWVAA